MDSCKSHLAVYIHLYHLVNTTMNDLTMYIDYHHHKRLGRSPE